ncbi:stage V sporulation protein AB [Ferviditalea candida]|uniref:Stage V sporulation protein AB n=1 Tax=Ferviditalea candida TaxID=3108399 RepID=A0ABU5ZJW2_9BACL|nr:stage V sporulation protein AB [Paenibacillaceae bacterium T2]
MSGLLPGGAVVIIGLAWGVAVGSGLVAFLAVLGVIPRLAQITRSTMNVRMYEAAVIVGAVFWTVVDLFDIRFAFSPVGTALIGLLAGVFVGMLAAALTEVLNVLPIMAKRLHIDDYVIWLVMAMVIGKVLGSLFDWLVFHSLILSVGVRS